jgi:hypothetical protein
MDELVIDAFSGLNHKATMQGGGSQSFPGYLDGINLRRIQAYTVIRAYRESVARTHTEFKDPDQEDAWRELGDVAPFLAQIAHGVLGKSPMVGVVDADRPIADRPDIPPPPKQPVVTEGTDPRVTAIDQIVYDTSIELWEANAADTLERWLEDIKVIPELRERQDWLRNWATSDGFIGKVTENERENICVLGSGVYAVLWDTDQARPKTEIFEPDVYFPVLDDAEPSVFPARVHLVWHRTELVNGKDEDFVRRITYELLRVEDLEGFNVGPRPGYLADTDPWTHICVQSDGMWPIDAFEELDGINKGVTWRKVMIDGAEVELNQWPTGLDFIPLVHVPHTLASATHFGRSPIPAIAQLLDELAATDTDESLASRWAARPPMAIEGLVVDGEDATVDVSPGKGFTGKVTVINMAENLEKIGARIAALLKRVSVNIQVPEGLVGRLDATDVPSGAALSLSFTAYEQTTEASRLARVDKYPLLMKMVQRIAIHNQAESLNGSTVVYPAEVRFGAFMPQDLAGVAATIVGLLNAWAVSQETALVMLQDAGVPTEDLQAELASIRAVMTEHADQLTAATEDPRYAIEFLGRDPDEFAVDGGVDPDAGVETPVGAAVNGAEPLVGAGTA